MTEQQMPARIWVNPIAIVSPDIYFPNAVMTNGNENIKSGDVSFIRADLAERMAEALEGLVKAINYRDACSVSRTSALRIADASMRLQSEIEETQAALSAFRSAPKTRRRVMTERAEHITPTIGQFVIVRADYAGWHLVSVESVTAKQFKGKQDGTGWKRTVSTASIKFCGDEESARKLHERLISSRAQFDDERQRSAECLKARDDALIAAATGANHDS